MRQYFAVVCSLLFLGCAHGGENYVKIKGSETVLPITLKLAEAFSDDPTKPNLAVTAGGSGVGIAALLQENTDIAMASRGIKFQEKVQFKEHGLRFVETTIAYDALAVIVHNDNPLDTITLENLSKIFRGELTNWKALGGPDETIVPFNRESSSGTYSFFKKAVLGGEKFGKLQTVGANGELVEKVASNPKTIGYVGIAYVGEGQVKRLKIYNPARGAAIDATIRTAMDNSYPLTRPLFFYHLERDAEKVRPVMDFILSSEGQRLVEASGYPPNPAYYAK